MYKDGKIFGKFNILDFIIICVVIVLVLGIALVKTKLVKPLAKISSGEKTVEFVVTTRAYDVAPDKELFKVGEKTFITIRNVPYTELEIVDVKKEPMKEMFFNYDRPEIQYLLENVAYPNRFIYNITVKDKAQITNDAPVIGGNKIKIGLPVDIEGFYYRFSGTVSDVKIIEETKE